VSWERYRWFRPKVIARANAIGVEAVQVERALHEIDVATNTNISISWDDYLLELRRCAEQRTQSHGSHDALFK
jgi:hypothetical protein